MKKILITVGGIIAIGSIGLIFLNPTIPTSSENQVITQDENQPPSPIPATEDEISSPKEMSTTSTRTLTDTSLNEQINEDVLDVEIQTSDIIKEQVSPSMTLLPPPTGKIYFNAFPDFGGSEDQVSSATIESFETTAGKRIMWAYFSQNWMDGIVYPTDAIQEITNSGAIPFVRLMPHSNWGSTKEPVFTMQKIIDGTFDAQLRQWAKGAKSHNGPLLIDFAVEPTGDWFPWSGIYNGAGITTNYGDPNYPDGPERYRDAYRHIIDIFRDEKVQNVTWFFHPDIHRIPNKKWNSAKYYYPGDEYIDWIGMSIYGAQIPVADEEWETFEDILKENYQYITEISTTKPIALLEFGVTDNHPSGNKAQWLTDAFATIKNNPYIDFGAISYWHENWDNDGDISTIRIDSSKESLQAFQTAVQNPAFISQGRFSNYSMPIRPALLQTAPLEIHTAPSSPTASLLFTSGFEQGVSLGKEVSDEDGVWWQKILGTDSTGFSWPMNIFGHKGELQLLVDGDTDIGSYITNTITTTTNANGAITRALHQNITKKQQEDTQDPYIIYTDGGEVEDLYIRYSLRYPENLVEILGNDGWAVLSEFKTTGDYRLALYVYQEDGQLYWYMHGDNVVLDDAPYKEYWYKENKIIPVPTGEWFDVEIFWHRSTEDDGYVWWAIDGKQVAEFNGPTRIEDSINAIMVFTNYSSGPLEQWVDNVEIWDDFPCGYKNSCIQN